MVIVINKVLDFIFYVFVFVIVIASALVPFFCAVSAAVFFIFASVFLLFTIIKEELI